MLPTLAPVLLTCRCCARCRVLWAPQSLADALYAAGHLAHDALRRYVEYCLCTDCLARAATGDTTPATEDHSPDVYRAMSRKMGL